MTRDPSHLPLEAYSPECVEEILESSSINLSIRDHPQLVDLLWLQR
jgi:hypothetical protein